MTVGIASPYFGTIGGGERYMLTAAKFFQDRGDKVDVFSKGTVNAQIAEDFFGLDLSRVDFVDDIFFGPETGKFSRILSSQKYDLIFFLSDGSIPTSLARNNWLHFQTPFNYQNQRTLVNKLKLGRFQEIICNSKFTKKYIDQTYGLRSKVIYPPIDVNEFSSKTSKKNIILSTGRFSDPKNIFQHAKKQEVLVKIFRDLVKSGLRDWQLVLTGSLEENSISFLSKIKKESRELPVEIITNPTFDQLQDHYARAKIFWHAVGFGEDLIKNPARAEHFGITTVEAMASGAVPVVFAGGGLMEIIQEGNSGFLWKTAEGLKKNTMQLITDPNLLKKMSNTVQSQAMKFDIEQFYSNLSKLLT